MRRLPPCSRHPGQRGAGLPGEKSGRDHLSRTRSGLPIVPFRRASRTTGARLRLLPWRRGVEAGDEVRSRADRLSSPRTPCPGPVREVPPDGHRPLLLSGRRSAAAGGGVSSAEAGSVRCFRGCLDWRLRRGLETDSRISRRRAGAWLRRGAGPWRGPAAAAWIRRRARPCLLRRLPHRGCVRSCLPIPACRRPLRADRRACAREMRLLPSFGRSVARKVDSDGTRRFPAKPATWIAPPVPGPVSTPAASPATWRTMTRRQSPASIMAVGAFRPPVKPVMTASAGIWQPTRITNAASSSARARTPALPASVATPRCRPRLFQAATP